MKTELRKLIEKNGMDSVLAMLSEIARDESTSCEEMGLTTNVEAMDEIANQLAALCSTYNKLEW